MSHMVKQARLTPLVTNQQPPSPAMPTDAITYTNGSPPSPSPTPTAAAVSISYTMANVDLGIRRNGCCSFLRHCRILSPEIRRKTPGLAIRRCLEALSSPLPHKFASYRSIIARPLRSPDSHITPRHSFTLWLGLKDRLQTRDKLPELIEEKVCPLCSAADETIGYLFFQCVIGNQVWSQIKQWLGITRAMTTLKSAVKWIIKEARGTWVKSKAKKIGLACSVYYIWETRNERIFEELKSSVIYLQLSPATVMDGC
ncbi:LOB domain-containing protein [Actinidia chinensis var. chinensis]|uniref:LOB domain-containing protein n=1 Tax=Actinidia chinensis var. chinensis TaxID=1590841 RepID=A0A2R6QG19_ACTCC|nr:LOB domain-containing protein [Actinidia chinensis var. chinensis]